MKNIYRTEAINAHRNRVYGDVVIWNTRSTKFLFYMILITCLSILFLISTFNYSRVEIVPGFVTTSEQIVKVYPTKTGIIQKVMVANEQKVSPQQILCSLTVDIQAGEGQASGINSLNSLEKNISIIEDQLKIVKITDSVDIEKINESISLNKKEFNLLVDQENIQKDIVDSSQKMLDEAEPVVQKGYISRLEFERRKQQLLIERQKLRQNLQQQNQNIIQLKQYESQLTRLPLELEKQTNDLKATLASLDQQRHKLRAEVNNVILSPVGGTITSLQANTGKYADPKFPLLTIIPEGSEFVVEVYAPSKAMGFVQIGQEARIMYDAFPYTKFGSFKGRVVEISNSISHLNDIDLPIKMDEAAFRIRISVDDQSIKSKSGNFPLRPGMKLKASLILDRKSVVDWILAPFQVIRSRS